MLGATVLLAACDESSPTAPSVTPEGPTAAAATGPETLRTSSEEAAADGSTLKAGTPTAQSPVNGVEVNSLQPNLTVANVDPRFVDSAMSPAFRYQFEWGLEGGGAGSTQRRTVDGGDGTTSAAPTEPLLNGRAYRWRARAVLDGAQGPWSDWSTFRTQAASIGVPNLLQPADGELVNSVFPILEVENPTQSGNVGQVRIEFQVATDPGFANVVAAMSPAQGTHAGIDRPLTGTPQALSREEKTSAQVPDTLNFDTTYFWRARGVGNVSSPWSGGRSFQTGSEAEVNSSSGGGGGGVSTSSGTAADQINLSQVRWLHHDVSGWPQTSTISSTRIGAPPICINHSRSGNWPRVSIFGGTVIEANVWVFANIGGQWYAATWEWLRPGQTCKSLDGSDFRTHVNGAAPLSSWRPKSGEKVGLMVSTPARFGPDGPKRERSNVVVVTWP